MDIVSSFSPFDGKRCPKCQKWQPFDAFNKERTRKDGHGIYCRQCLSKPKTPEGLFAQEQKAKGLKRCSKCEEWLSLDSFHRDPNRGDGRYVYCKLCQSHQPEKRRLVESLSAQGLKRCNVCGKDKPFADFYKVWNKESTLRPECICCNRAAQIAKRGRPRILRPKLPKMPRVKVSEEYRRAGSRRRALAYYYRHPEKCKALAYKYRSRKQQCEGSFTRQEWEDLCAKYDHRCLCCGERKPLTVDHIVPLTLGGANYITSVQPLCRSCNSKKSAKIIDYRR